MILQNKLKQAQQLEQIAKNIYREVLGEAISKIFKKNIYHLDVGMKISGNFDDDDLFIFMYEEDDGEIVIAELVFDIDEDNVIQDIIVKHNYDEEYTEE